MEAPLTTENLRTLVTSLASLSSAVDDADRIERIRQIETLKSTLCAVQAATAAEFERSRRAEQAAAGVPADRQARGVAAQVALARRISPWAAQRWLGWAKILTTELPATYRELAAGRTSEWRAMLVARETACLSRGHRATVDLLLAPQLEGWGDRRVETETRKAAYRLDPHAAVERARNAETERRVSLRPAPDTMCRLSALLPVAQGVAAYAALARAADTSTATGDERGRGQIMADTLTERLTGHTRAESVPVEINLVMTDEAMLGNTAQSHPAGRNEPAWIEGYGPVPAPWARELAYSRDNAGTRWIRRLYQHQGQLVALDSTRRLFTPGQQRFLRLRDQTCRTPWCDAPIRHADHVQPHATGGPTRTDNGQGLCQACNHARQAPNWHARTDQHNVITIKTSTGHTYRSPPPTLTGPPDPPLERQLSPLLAAV